MEGMELIELHASGKKEERVNLMFLADGCKFPVSSVSGSTESPISVFARLGDDD